jgi:hypothetical protein
MVVDVDEELSFADKFLGAPQPGKIGRVGGYNQVEALPGRRPPHLAFPVEESQLVRHRILVPDRDIFAAILKCAGETQLASDAVTIGSDMSHDANGLSLFDSVENLFDDFRAILHEVCG